MSTSVQKLNIEEFMNRHLVEVFDTMLSMKAVPAAKFDPPHFTERVSGSVGFAGDNVNGAVYIHLSASFASRITATMLGMEPAETCGESDVNDVVGEVTNMLGGGLKSALCDAGAPCAVSTPAIIRGTSFVIEAVPEVRQIYLLFLCEKEQIFVEVHIKSD